MFKFSKKIRQSFCNHKFIAIESRQTMHPAEYLILLRCEKCGKTQNAFIKLDYRNGKAVYWERFFERIN